VEQLLVAGIDTVVGANLAAHLSDKYRVLGISSAASVSIEGCETAVVPSDDAHSVRQLAAAHRPDRIVLCGHAGDSAWHQIAGRIAPPAAIESARAWTRTARELDLPLTLISSDAVFTGPWMFHAEGSKSFCSSAPARSLRALESCVLEECPTALVVRTHAYGWSPLADGPGWIEGIVAALESERPGIFECAPHGTPILATDLAEILPHVWEAELSGIYHIAGAERVNPHRFVCALARVFDLAPPRATVLAPAEAAGSAFGQGETSLRSDAIHRAVGLPMPMLIEGLQRLRDQQGGGYDRRFRGSRRLTPSKVA
jgi:dTDP-4-dehydrorhamnose reductase